MTSKSLNFNYYYYYYYFRRGREKAGAREERRYYCITVLLFCDNGFFFVSSVTLVSAMSASRNGDYKMRRLSVVNACVKNSP